LLTWSQLRVFGQQKLEAGNFLESKIDHFSRPGKSEPRDFTSSLEIFHNL